MKKLFNQKSIKIKHPNFADTIAALEYYLYSPKDEYGMPVPKAYRITYWEVHCIINYLQRLMDSQDLFRHAILEPEPFQSLNQLGELHDRAEKLKAEMYGALSDNDSTKLDDVKNDIIDFIWNTEQVPFNKIRENEDLMVIFLINNFDKKYGETKNHRLYPRETIKTAIHMVNTILNEKFKNVSFNGEIEHPTESEEE